MTPVFGIKHRVTGQWLRVKWTEGGGEAVLSDNPLDAWVSYRDKAATHVSQSQRPDEWEVVEHPTFDFEIIKAWSDRKISRHEAMDKLGIDWYGVLLDMLGWFDLPYPMLPEAKLKAQVDGAMRFFAMAEGYSPDLRATIRRDGDTFIAYIEHDGALDATEAAPDPVALAKKLIDRKVYIGFVASEDKAVADAVKGPMRRLMDEAGSST